MTDDELRSFIEERLLEFDPLIDLTPGSDAQSQIIDPILQKMGLSVFSSDFREVGKDRLFQEYRIAVTEGDGVDDMLLKPGALLGEPFKRATMALKARQSVRYPDTLSEEDADAIAANWFVTRREGERATGIARLLLTVPTALTVTPSIRFLSNEGLGFFPVEEQSITTDQMLLQKSGGFYYFDVVVQAEEPGEEYTLEPGELTDVEGLGVTLQVTNPRRFTPGSDREDNDEFLARVAQSLTERSLTSSRGNRARISEVFEDVVSMEIVGFGDPEMQRDILTGEADGNIFASGTALAVRQYLIAFDGYEDRGEDGALRPEVGDKVILNYAPPWHISQTQDKKLEQFTITRILFSSLDAGFTGWPGIFLYELDRLPTFLDPPAMSFTPWLTGIFLSKFAHFKTGTISVSDMPGGIQNPDTVDGRLRVEQDKVHMGGHYDVYLRPTVSAEDSIVLENLTDNLPMVRGNYLRTMGGTPFSNIVEGWVNGMQVDWIQLGAQPGMTLVIENGLDAGSYGIKGVRTDSLILDTDLTAAASGLRFKVLDELNLDLVNPREQKLPTPDLIPTDLVTTAGSTTVELVTTNLFDYGVEENDSFVIEEGPDAGEYTIVSFDQTLGGRGPILDRAPSTSSINLMFSVFTRQEGLQLPLVKIRSVEVLDSRGQPSGLTVPYSEPVMVTNRCCFTGSERLCDGINGFVMPDIEFLEPNPDYSEYEGCSEQHLLVSEMASGMDVGQTWYKLTEIICTPGDEDDTPCIPSSLEHLARVNWALTFGDSNRFNEVPSGDPDPENWSVADWDYAEDNGIVPERVAVWDVLTALSAGQILPWTNEMAMENPDIVGDDGNLLWFWFEKVEDVLYGEPYEALGPFRSRRWYSEGCRDCDGHIVCVCIDYNTQFEVCLPEALFDGCNNVFVALPDIDFGALLDHLEEVVYQHRLVSPATETPGEYDYEYEYEGSYDPGSYEETPVSMAEILSDFVKKPCLCESEPGDVLTLGNGANAGSYIIEELHTMTFDISLLLEEGDQERLSHILQETGLEEEGDLTHQILDFAEGASYHTIPVDVCLAKIEGQFPAKNGEWLSNLFSGPLTIEELFGDYHTALLTFIANALGLQYDPENPASSSLQEWWDAYKEVDIRALFLRVMNEFFGIDLRDGRIPLNMGCEGNEGILGKLIPTQNFNTWEEWFQNISKSYNVDEETLALFVVLLRRLNAFGPMAVVEMLSDDQFFDRLSDQGFDMDALFYGGGLTTPPFLELFNSLFQMVIGSLEDDSGVKAFVEFMLTIFGSFFYAMLFLPLATVWNIATEGNPDLVPEKMVIDLDKLWEFVRELMFTPYSVGKSICDNFVRTYFLEPTTVEFDAGLGACEAAVPPTPSMFATKVGEEELLFSASSDVVPFDIVPHREGESPSDTELPRDIEVLDPAVPAHRDKMVFTDPGLGSPLTAGVEPGRDELELHEQRFILPAPEPSKLGGIVVANKQMLPGLISTSGSAFVEIPDTAVYGWTRNQVGDLIFIEKGPDSGGYRIVNIVNGKKAELDRPLTYTTLPILKEGYRATYDFKNSNEFEDPDASFEPQDEGRYLTVYGSPLTTHNGSYQISKYVSPTKVELDLGAATFLTGVVNGIGMWATTDAPQSPPEMYDEGGRETVAVVPFRQYFGEATIFKVTAVSTSLGTDGYLRVALEDEPVNGLQRYPQDGYQQPFRIVRPGVQRFPSTEMAQNQEDGLYYVDVKVRSLGAGEDYNLPEDSRLWAVFGSYKSDGYRYVVEDTKYSFSPEEQVGIIVSPRILPVGNPDRPDSMVSLSGQTIQINYDHAPTVLNVHQFINSRLDRPVCANPLARHYLPAWVYLFIRYRGGAEPEELVGQIDDLIKSLGPLDALQVDEVERIVKQAGADYIEHPITLRAAILDLRRNWIVVESDNFLESDADDPEFLGTDRLTYFIPGTDTSREPAPPPGPQIRPERTLGGPIIR